MSNVIESLKGKLSYMAPEQAMTAEIDHRADLFAVGVILWEAIAGRRMISRKQEDSVTISNRVSGHEPSIDEVCPDAPAGIRAICRKAMAIRPADRYASAKELRTALLQYLSSVQQSPTAEDLASVVGELFAKERAAIAASIAKTIAADEPITIDPAVLDAWNTYTGENPLRTGDDLDIEIVAGEPTRLDNRWDKSGAKADIVIPLKTNPATQNVDSGPGKSGKKGLWILASGTALAAVVGTLLVLTGGEEEARAVSEVGSDSQSKVVQPIVTDVDAPKGEKEIQLVVSASPSNALIELDGVRIDNPYVGRKIREPGEHILKISAQGYETQTKTISFDSKGEWKFALLADKTNAVAVGAVDNSAALNRRGRNKKRGGRRGSGQNANLTPTQTVAVVEKTVGPEPPVETKRVVKDQSVQKQKRVKMGDDLGKASTKTSTKVKIDRNNPYQ
ncbi:MAG: PEGA domain-containing protein [Kofleriaceae bacterium]|nr:PEGA domain-containing protein [Kofleriaceae bacterium]